MEAWQAVLPQRDYISSKQLAEMYPDEVVDEDKEARELRMYYFFESTRFATLKNIFLRFAYRRSQSAAQ